MTSQRERREWRANSEREKTPAPAHTLQGREVFAVEHPMIIQNLDKALKTFGTNRPFRRVRFYIPFFFSARNEAKLLNGTARSTSQTQGANVNTRFSILAIQKNVYHSTFVLMIP